MRKITSYFILLLFFETLIGCCDCDKSIKCPSLSEIQRGMINKSEGDSLVFLDNTEERLVFYVKSSYIVEPRASIPCRSRRFAGCDCDYVSCGGKGSYTARTLDSNFVRKDTNGRIIEVFNNIRISFDNEYYSSSIRVDLLDMRYQEIQFDTSNYSRGITYNHAMLFNGITFYDVFEVSIQNSEYNPYVSKFFMNQEKGLLAFEVSESKKMYYLQNIN